MSNPLKLVTYGLHRVLCWINEMYARILSMYVCMYISLWSFHLKLLGLNYLKAQVAHSIGFYATRATEGYLFRGYLLPRNELKVPFNY